MWQFWLITAGVFLIAEVITVGFLVFWLAIGALFAMIVSLFTDSLLIQTAVFVISSIILIFATKPFIKKFAKNDKAIKTNVYSVVGKVGIVTKDIDSINVNGQIKVEGEIWSAIGQNDINIEKGTQVQILEIDGVRAVVAPVNVISKSI